MPKRLHRSRPAMLAVAFSGLVPAIATAHEAATGVVKERMDMMQTMATHMKAVSAMARGERPMDAEAVKRSAKTLSEHAATLPGKFPDGSHQKPTAAKPEIWREPDQFQALWADLTEKVAALSQAGESGDRTAVAKAFRGIGRVCSACHKTYRAKNH